MKKSIAIMGATALSLLVLTGNAQTETTTQPPKQTWDPRKNPVVTDITSKYNGKYIAPATALSTAEIFPVTGNFSSATNPEAPEVSVTLDEQNKGLIWVEGLPQGTIKAMLRKLPDTYKIPAQKTEAGKEVAEGTLVYDNETSTLSICIGKLYNTEDPSSAFTVPAEEPAPAVAKKKTGTKKANVAKAWIYTGTKQVTKTAAK
jgi:hypothetical protein